MPIIEANSIGRPVVTSNRSPMTEVSGGAAVLVNPDDVISIRDGIKKILENSEFRDQLIQLGLKNAQRFSISVVAKQYEKIYRELAKP
jgi:glycosyltransferase involved in cell wall biosynthesis